MKRISTVGTCSIMCSTTQKGDLASQDFHLIVNFSLIQKIINIELAKEDDFLRRANTAEIETEVLDASFLSLRMFCHFTGLCISYTYTYTQVSQMRNVQLKRKLFCLLHSILRGFYFDHAWTCVANKLTEIPLAIFSASSILGLFYCQATDRIDTHCDDAVELFLCWAFPIVMLSTHAIREAVQCVCNGLWLPHLFYSPM